MALPAFHALTGCESTSSISGISKMKQWKAILRSQVHQESLSLLGQEQEEDEENAKHSYVTSIHPRRRDHRLLMSSDTSCSVRRNRRMRRFHQLLIICNSTSVVPTTRCMEKFPWDARNLLPSGTWMDNGRWGASTAVDDEGSHTQQSTRSDNLRLLEGEMSKQLFMC